MDNKGNGEFQLFWNLQTLNFSKIVSRFLYLTTDLIESTPVELNLKIENNQNNSFFDEFRHYVRYNRKEQTVWVGGTPNWLSGLQSLETLSGSEFFFLFPCNNRIVHSPSWMISRLRWTSA